MLTLVSRNYREKLGLLCLRYQFENFKIQVDLFANSKFVSVYQIKNTRFPELQISKLLSGPPMVKIDFFITDKPEDLITAARELESAARLIPELEKLDIIVCQEQSSMKK